MEVSESIFYMDQFLTYQFLTLVSGFRIFWHCQILTTGFSNQSKILEKEDSDPFAYPKRECGQSTSKQPHKLYIKLNTHTCLQLSSIFSSSHFWRQGRSNRFDILPGQGLIVQTSNCQGSLWHIVYETIEVVRNIFILKHHYLT